MEQSSRPFYLLTWGVILILLLPILAQDGMFLDGVLYSSVGKNLANGYGTFWAPRFSEYGIANSPIFHEHPPLNFGIQAIFYKILGNGFLTERIYSLLTAILNAGLIHLIWKELEKKDHRLRGMSWWALLLWILLPLTYWCFQNNVQENTMGIFVLSSVWFLMRYLDSGRLMLLIGCGVSLFLASFSKGVTGLFPLGAIVFWSWTVGRKDNNPDNPIPYQWHYARVGFGRVVRDTLILLVIVFAIYGLLLSYGPAYDNLMGWFEGRFLHRLDSAPTVDHRYRIWIRIFNEMIYTMAITAVLIGLFLWRKVDWLAGWSQRKKWVSFFFLLALSGSAPLVLTMVQKGFYMVPSYPFYAIAFALITAPGLQVWIKKMSKTGKAIVTTFSSVVIIAAIGVAAFLFHGTSRDQDVLPDMHRVGEEVPFGSTLSIYPDIWEDWRVQVYLQRYYHISLNPRTGDHTYFLTKAEEPAPDGYQEVDLGLTHHKLYRK
ncbi:glycosyltransferase family 39 protein [bacterium SCSIO 12741]|nr:glycosyltransferase family 39 protein [bacterium SCSIO 12741]